MKKSLVLLAVLALCVAAAVAVEDSQDAKRRGTRRAEETCEGELAALRSQYHKARAARLRELKIIKHMISIVKGLRSVKLQEDVEEESDVSEGRYHKEAHGKGGIIDILRSLMNKVRMEDRKERAALLKKQGQCRNVCKSAKNRAYRAYYSAIKHRRLMQRSMHAAVKRAGSLKARWRVARGAISAAVSRRAKGSAMLRKELKLVNMLISHAGRLSGVEFPQEAVQEVQEHAKTSDDYKQVLAQMQTKGSNVKMLKALLNNLKRKLLRELAGLSAAVRTYQRRAASAAKRYRVVVGAVRAFHRRVLAAKSRERRASTKLGLVRRQCNRIHRYSHRRALVQTDVEEGAGEEEDGGDDAMLMGLLGALSSGSKKSGDSMEKLLGALAGAEKEDVQESQDEDEDDDEDEDEEGSSDGTGASKVKNLHHDLKKVYRIAKKTHSIKKIANAAKKLKGSH